MSDDGFGAEKTESVEKSDDDAGQFRHHGMLEIAEALLLALVTVTTAWSGFQAAKWDGKNALLYGESSKYRTVGTQASTAAGQSQILDIVTFNRWISAETNGQRKLAALYAKRFSPRYHAAFEAWLNTHALTNPRAPAGPSFMPGYENRAAKHLRRYNGLADATFEKGTVARENGDKYVRETLLLASILFVIVISQRLRVKTVRHVLLAVACVLLGFGVYTLTTYPIVL